MPWSTTFEMSWETQLVILRPPEAPIAMTARPPCDTMAGDMLLRPFLNGAIEFGDPGTGLNHIIPSFITTPVPRGTIPEPNPAMMVLVSDTKPPRPSAAHR